MRNDSPPFSTRVLLVEDDEALREALTHTLTRAGFAVLASRSGADALGVARAERPDAAVIDLLLPDSGGLGVARELRRERALESIPVLFITGLSLPSVRTALAPTPVLFKPFTRRQLLDSLREVTRAT